MLVLCCVLGKHEKTLARNTTAHLSAEEKKKLPQLAIYSGVIYNIGAFTTEKHRPSSICYFGREAIAAGAKSSALHAVDWCCLLYTSDADDE